ncbi:MAG: family 65 glycosyl hydrolase [Lentisphaerae bacterium]|nr:family 65 glycosyl hydrolase [Lentisphaerota bacterium]
MPKQAKPYLKIDPWVIEEEGFHQDRALVSESVFSLANEFTGVRGYFEEGYGGKRMVGAYFNGIYVRGPYTYAVKFRGFADAYTHMCNAVDWLHTRLHVNGRPLDLAEARVSDFRRRLDMRRGVLERAFVWHVDDACSLRLHFARFVSMTRFWLGAQSLRIECLNGDADCELTLGLDFATTYYHFNRPVWTPLKQAAADSPCAIMAAAEGSGHRLFSAARIACDRDDAAAEPVSDNAYAGRRYRLRLKTGEAVRFERLAAHLAEKDADKTDDAVWKAGRARAGELNSLDFERERQAHTAYWERVWRDMDVSLEGDPANEQGLRFCIFNLHQTCHGLGPAYNIGAKGLTGEAYQGVAWWDTEPYCLPFYLFNDRRAAENLLRYRFRTLPGALERARQMEVEGARYPMCTIDGEETCCVWQHGDLQIHVSADVAYAIRLYDRVMGKTDWLYSEGIDMLLQICRYYASRGAWGQRTGLWGYFGVMGADEYHMMVQNNAYTNLMARKAFEYTLDLVNHMQSEAPAQWHAARERVALRDGELEDWRRKAAQTALLRDDNGLLIEQHEGFFNLPHRDVQAIPDDEFPLFRHHAYLTCLRHDMIKQPDVVLLLLLFSADFTRAEKEANYDFYEPRCCHESSLSPCIHAILAAELGRAEQAVAYSRYAYRLDLDDYNNNAAQGLHVTSMGGAWMSLVYGFGGLRTDGARLRFEPLLPGTWSAFSFRLRVSEHGILSVRVDAKEAAFRMSPGSELEIEVFGRTHRVAENGLAVPMPPDRVAQHTS